MIEILTNWGEDTLHNTINFLEGKEFEQEKDGFRPFPPGIYFSEDISFMKSMVNHYSVIRYQTSKKLRNMSIDEFWKYLESKKCIEGELRKVFQHEYLLEYKKKYNKHGQHKLVTLVSDKNTKRVHFIYKGLYLFGIIPEYFVRLC